jgi:hypothetical protein
MSCQENFFYIIFAKDTSSDIPPIPIGKALLAIESMRFVDYDKDKF